MSKPTKQAEPSVESQVSSNIQRLIMELNAELSIAARHDLDVRIETNFHFIIGVHTQRKFLTAKVFKEVR